MRSGISWLSRWTSPRPRLETELKSDQIRAPIAATTLCGGTERGRRTNAGEHRRALCGWLANSQPFAADSPLEGDGFEPSVTA